jgi:hypothetical protein
MFEPVSLVSLVALILIELLAVVLIRQRQIPVGEASQQA